MFNFYIYSSSSSNKKSVCGCVHLEKSFYFWLFFLSGVFRDLSFVDSASSLAGGEAGFYAYLVILHFEMHSLPALNTAGEFQNMTQ